MFEQIHDEEIDTSEVVVRALLADCFPQWIDAQLTYLDSSGTSNTMWRLQAGGEDLVVRLPRTIGAAASVRFECELLPVLASASIAGLVEIPEVSHLGQASDLFAHPWAIFSWIEGDDLWTHRDQIAVHQNSLAVELAGAVQIIGAIDDVPAPARKPGARGGPLPALLDSLDRWLTDPKWAAEGLIDVAAVRRSAAESAEVIDEPTATGFVHGDLIPGNLLARDGRLSAIIDWGGAGMGDLAQDLSPAWAVFDAEARQVFRSELDVDDATWLRARAFELEHAVGGITYYRPRGNALADVMQQTLDRILST